MTLQGWVQFALYALVIIHHEAAGRLHDPGVQRRADAALARAPAGRAAALQGQRRRRDAGAELGCLALVAMLLFSVAGFADALCCCSGLQAYLPFDPAGAGQHRAKLRLQHRSQLHL